MEEKKFDVNSFIGMILIGGILLWWMYSTKPEVDPNATTNTEQVTESTKADNSSSTNFSSTIESDSLKKVNLKNQLGGTQQYYIQAGDIHKHIKKDIYKYIIPGTRIYDIYIMIREFTN